VRERELVVSLEGGTQDLRSLCIVTEPEQRTTEAGARSRPTRIETDRTLERSDRAGEMIRRVFVPEATKAVIGASEPFAGDRFIGGRASELQYRRKRPDRILRATSAVELDSDLELTACFCQFESDRPRQRRRSLAKRWRRGWTTGSSTKY
jgi:hypothetical protein